MGIFGSHETFIIHKPNEKRTKMEPSWKKETFVGYIKSSKAYKIYVFGERHIEVIQDVTFHEEDAFKVIKIGLVWYRNGGAWDSPNGGPRF